MQGQRFKVGFEEGEKTSKQGPSLKFGLVGDINEREIDTSSGLPPPPKLKDQADGFPKSKDRRKVSQFKARQRTQDAVESDGSKAEARTPPTEQDNGMPSKAQIDEENKKRIESMTDEEIQAAQQEIMSSLNPSLIERFTQHPIATNEIQPQEEATRPPPPYNISKPISSAPIDDDAAPPSPPADLLPASQPPARIHFPPVPPAPDLDPSDPSFQSKLHDIYFPSLPSDPSALSWLAPITPAERATYSPSSAGLEPSSIRFDFRARLLPPLTADGISPTKGLHHHAHAPDKAGYTIPELARLARSAVPAQKCVAYQTLGRLLYRLGRGEFGREDDDMKELWRGLWQLVEREKVLDLMINDAADDEKTRNRSVWATATDAVWLWRKGGGKRFKGR